MSTHDLFAGSRDIALSPHERELAQARYPIHQSAQHSAGRPSGAWLLEPLPDGAQVQRSSVG
jgi:hypothetical protein